MEQLKQVPNFPLYSASSFGYILNNKSKRVLKECLLNCGYKQVSLCNNGSIKNVLVHRVIAKTFIENPENKKQVNHINGIKTDNSLENLEWNTRSENQLHSIKIGLRTTKGVKNSQCKLSEKEVLSIFNDERQYRFISDQYKVSIPTISDIKRGYSWSHITGLKSKKTGKTIYQKFSI